MAEAHEHDEAARDPQNVQQARLDQQVALFQRWLDHQEKSIKLARLVGWILIAMVLLLVVTLVVLTWISARNIAAANAADRQTTQPYRFTAEQLADIRDAEQRFKGVDSITSLVSAFGEPESVHDVVHEPSGMVTRRFLYPNKWQSIEVRVFDGGGQRYSLAVTPKTAATQP